MAIGINSFGTPVRGVDAVSAAAPAVARVPVALIEEPLAPAADQSTLSGVAPQAAAAPSSPSYQPLLNPVKLSAEVKARPVSAEALDRAQELLDKGDRGGAYLALYKELGNDQILIQTQITTYTGFFGAGALTGNNMAKNMAGDRYNTKLDDFSKEIAQATIDAVRGDLSKGGTGRLSDEQFAAADRDVWRKKGMAELFPGNIQFLDFWNHEKGDRAEAIFSPATWNIMEAGVRSFVPDTSLFGLNHDGRNLAHLVGKRPSEFANNPNYETFGGDKDRFITVVDKRTGFVEAFWDKHPHLGKIPMKQLPDKPLAPDSHAYQQRQALYQHLGANQHGSQAALAPDKLDQSGGWLRF